MDLIVRRIGAGEAILHCGDDRFRAAIGAGGIGVKRSEGDGVTPIGVFPPRLVLYRADRLVSHHHVTFGEDRGRRWLV